MEQLRIDSGLYQCQVVDENGNELGILSFNPMDFNLPARLDAGWRRIQKELDEAKKAFCKYSDKFDKAESSDADGISLDEDTFSSVSKIISDIDSKIKNELDFIFDTDISKIFGNTHLATPTKSGFLIESLMYALMPVIEREIKSAQKASAKRKSKYTARYQK